MAPHPPPIGGYVHPTHLNQVIPQAIPQRTKQSLVRSSAWDSENAADARYYGVFR